MIKLGVNVDANDIKNLDKNNTDEAIQDIKTIIEQFSRGRAKISNFQVLDAYQDGEDGVCGDFMELEFSFKIIEKGLDKEDFLLDLEEEIYNTYSGLESVDLEDSDSRNNIWHGKVRIYPKNTIFIREWKK